MPPAVRLSDKAACPSDAHGCPACPHPTFGPAVNGSTDVMINKLPAIRLGDPGIHAACCGPNQWKVAKGSPSVYVNKKPLARMGDKTTHCGGSGNIIQGSPNVFADDAAGGALKALLAKLRDLLAGKSADGKYKGKDEKESGSWAEKGGKGSGKAGKGKEGKAGEGKDEDLSKTEEGGADTGILKMKLERTRVSAKGEVKFELHLASSGDPAKDKKEQAKDVAVKALRKSDQSKAAETSVKGKPGETLKGSFIAPEFKDDEEPPILLVVTAKHPDKPDTYTCGDEVTVGEPGLYLTIYEEPPVLDDKGGTVVPWPTNEEAFPPKSGFNADCVESVVFQGHTFSTADANTAKRQGDNCWLFKAPDDKPELMAALRKLVDGAKTDNATAGLVGKSKGKEKSKDAAAKIEVKFKSDPYANVPEADKPRTWCWALYVPPPGRGKK